MASSLEVLRTVKELRALRARLTAEGQRLALVPTMGALHSGHLALVRRAAREGDFVMASVFVNPTQFGPHEDFDRYPRDEAGDFAKLTEAGCHAVFAPTVSELYPEGSETRVHPGAMGQVLCGASRPGHFAGVLTVVLALLNATGCDVAVFGEKDYQQLTLIRRMVRDLHVPVRVVGHAIVREPDGLAMSSRNAYLSPAERTAALALSEGLTDATLAYADGMRAPEALLAHARARLDATPSAKVDYVAIYDAETLGEPSPERPMVLAMAVKFGATRLIDNRVLGV